MYAQLCQVRRQNSTSESPKDIWLSQKDLKKISDGVNFLGEIDLQVAQATKSLPKQ